MFFQTSKFRQKNLTSLGRKHNFRQKVNIVTGRLQEAIIVIPSKYNGVVVVEILNLYLFWVEFYTKNLQLEMTINVRSKNKV